MHGKGPFVRNEWLYKKVCSSCDRGGEPLNPRGDRGDTSNRPWGQDSTPAKAILQQSRAGVWCQLCLSLLCFLGEPRGSARRSPHPGLQPRLQNCTCCISTGSLEDIPGSPWQGRELQGIPEWTRCRLSNAVLDLWDKDSGALSSVQLCLLW